MKTNKLKLADLNVESFTTLNQRSVKGGTDLIYTVYYITDDYECQDSSDCPTRDGAPECYV